MFAGFYRLFAIAALSYRVAIVGDVGNGSAEVARGIALAGRIDAIILTGDNIYPCGVKSGTDPKWSVLEPLSKLGVPIYPVLGNHDYCGDPDAQINAPLANWHFPSREYTITTPVAEFHFIDTTPYVRGLKPAPHFSFGQRWRIVVGHHPILSSGYHGHFPRDEHLKMRAMLPALSDADLYIAGHDHHLELIEEKPLMLISGAGSAPISALFPHLHTRWASEDRMKGFAIIDFTSTSMTIRFYDARGAAVSAPFNYSRP